ncbi:MAG: DUF2155 domain-containing protein [Pseudomonadota bacterium]
MKQVNLKHFYDVLQHLQKSLRCGLFVLVVLALISFQSLYAEKIENDIAVFAALDKVTARISKLEVRIGQSVTFGALTVTPRVCFSRPPTEPPLTSSFVEVDEVKIDKSAASVFKGWMFAQSPGLSGVQHPVFDVWLTKCKMDNGGASSGSKKKSAL